MRKIRLLVRSLSQTSTNGTPKCQPGTPKEPVSWHELYTGLPPPLSSSSTPPSPSSSSSSPTGLVAIGDQFTLNGREIQILSGSLHYFRVHPSYWRDSLRKMRAAGLNTVQTYVPWNLHEPQMDVYDFGEQPCSDMTPFLKLSEFVRTAHEEDLFVIIRPGPYICAEWDFGGLPSYLLRDDNMCVRSTNVYYMERVTKWFNRLLPYLAELQFTRNGPIIAFQLENELGAFGYEDFPRDTPYLQQLRDLMVQNSIVELLFTSDSPLFFRDMGALPSVMQAANFQSNGEQQLKMLRTLQPDRPQLVAELWTGWYNHWMAEHRTHFNVEDFRASLSTVLASNASVNLYMFMGGTSFGFMAGANYSAKENNYLPDTSSYDYDAVLTEGGRYTEKYAVLRELLSAQASTRNISAVEPPEQPQITAYEGLMMTEQLPLAAVRKQLPPAENSCKLLSMEQLAANEGSGQSSGIVWYSASAGVVTQKKSQLKLGGHVRDFALIVLDNQTVLTQKPESQHVQTSIGYWNARDAAITLTCSPGKHTLDILVENMGRVNYGPPHVLNAQRKGLYERPVEIDGKTIDSWDIHSMEMKSKWINSLQDWKALDGGVTSPCFLRGVLNVEQTADTYLDMRNFTKGSVFINGFNLGRYMRCGPVYTLYLPAPLLKPGENQIVVFEQFGSENPKIEFRSNPVYAENKSIGPDWLASHS